ncbi:Gamma-glutamyl-hercynylcysteine sulfoxide hydrolase [Rubrobacter xylanophilus DSM 9941]|uniref:ergothioneine biosynthesis protein EgtC n=1 Tax=Rubrobacter xylanophilus TaxID=49319 RepID=UPI001C6403A3|nr:ergothioneine biosynthesis protein EgtC [Rubrobacter xylanophilus]QYJ16881.1 Gamma-glutamyl-hercynylcysteine sulfoxide hydrolase [Rubrobacter xylanophilus DSM 9941]
MAAYVGERRIPLSALVLESGHSLLVQSYAPREMRSGVVNADGFGVGWYAPEVDGEPAVYRSVRPIWTDRSFASIAPRVLSPTVFAAVRSATPGLPAEESGVPPFASGRHLFMHNGAVEDFRRSAMRRLRDTLSDESYAGLLGVSDSETIFACLLDRLRDSPEDLAGALRETAAHLFRTCAELGVEATLNLAVTDGETMVFTRCSTDGPGNSLYFLEDAGTFREGVAVASEPLDETSGWREVPDRHLLSAGRSTGAALEPLDLP